MAPLSMIDPYHAIAGALVGLAVGMTGVGGGSLMTPLLVLMFGFAPATAVGTDLLFAGLTKAVGSSVHGARGTVDWRIVGRLAAGSIPAAMLMLLMLAQNRPTRETEHVITLVLGITLVLTALSVLLRDRIVTAAQGARVVRGWQRHRTIATIILGAVLGTVVTISSVGAGAIGVTALLVLYPAMPVGRLVGSDIAHAVPLTLIAGLGHLGIGTVDLSLLASLLVGSVPAVIIGSLIGSRASDRILRPLLAVVLALVGIRLLIG